MLNRSGLIVLEGLDGSGKSTQFERLSAYFSENDIKHKAISFPDYDNPSSALVKMYLNGEIGKTPADVNAYAASSFYAVDRYACYKQFWEHDYKEGSLVLAARYVTSNCIYQMTKLPKEQWEDFIGWLEDYEYDKLGLPRPDKVIFLDMPIRISMKQMWSILKNAVKPLCLPLRNRLGILFLAAMASSLIQKIRFSEMFWG